jgi:hypothetical protein
MSNDKRKIGDCKKGDRVVTPSKGYVEILDDPTVDPINEYVNCLILSSGKEVELAKICKIY